MINSQFYENVKKECKIRNIKIGEMLDSCGLNKSYLSDLKRKNVNPNLESASKIANYLGVSMEYLTNNKENSSSNVINNNFGTHCNNTINPNNQYSFSSTAIGMLSEFEKLEYKDQLKVMNLIAELSEKEGA